MNPFGVTPQRYDVVAIAAWNAEIVRSREEYAAHPFERPSDGLGKCTAHGCWNDRETERGHCDAHHYAYRTARAIANSAKQKAYRERKKVKSQ